MLFLNNEQIQSILDMKTTLEALQVGYQDLAEEGAAYRARIDFWVPCEIPKHLWRWGSMEGASRKLGMFAIRMKSDVFSYPEGKVQQKYCVQPGTYCGLIFVFSTRNGEPLAIMNDGYLQHMRVGGSAGVGAKYLSRPDSRTVGMIGSGGMARTFLQAFCQMRPIKHVKVYSVTPSHREAYAAEMSRELNIEVEPVDSPAKAAKGVDILATATNSVKPTVRADWLEPGMHLTNVNPYEIELAVANRCDVTVQLGDFSVDPSSATGFKLRGTMAGIYIGTPEELSIIPEPTHKITGFPHLIDVMSGKFAGRTNEKQITFFDNMGTQGVQFVAVAGWVVRLAKEKGIGQEIPTEWFLQDIVD